MEPIYRLGQLVHSTTGAGVDMRARCANIAGGPCWTEVADSRLPRTRLPVSCIAGCPCPAFHLLTVCNIFYTTFPSRPTLTDCHQPLLASKVAAMLAWLRETAYKLTWSAGRIPRQDGRVFIVTGGNSGIGRASRGRSRERWRRRRRRCCRHLARTRTQGWAGCCLL
jgi:hypothetical protein